jgi:nitrogen PTS system EIIA component
VLLTELLDANRVKIPLSARNKDEVLRELVGLVVRGQPDTAVLEQVLGSVRQRENVLSTGIGDGIAIPHGKTPLVDQLVMAAGVAPTPVDFDALDGRPVHLFFMLVGPESAASAHVKALSRISRLLRRGPLRDELRNAASGEAFMEIIRRSEPA